VSQCSEGWDHGAKALHIAHLELEVERLTALLSQVSNTTYIKMAQERADLEAENERLRRQSAAFQEMTRKNGNTISEYRADVKRLQAEVERLRAELHDAEVLIADLRDGVKLNEEYRQEVERLRAESETRRGIIEREAVIVADLSAEVERLTAALEVVADFLETASATAARRDEPEMARIMSNVSHKTRAALAKEEE
jgi:predicted RNase H-like nuclease (RuvC/YqgF family)